MVAIGRAMMTRPTLVLLDEASMGLAPIIVEEIFELIGRLNRDNGVSFLLAERTPISLCATPTTPMFWRTAASRSQVPPLRCVPRRRPGDSTSARRAAEPPRLQ